MKVIDLLVKIANGEEVPKKIKYEGIIFTYSEYDKDYLEFPFSEEEYRGLFNMKDSILTQYLNDEVETIEDIPKKIKKLNRDYALISENIEKGWTPNELVILDKLEEIIDKINGEENE